jgi:hypothetical protein
MNTFQAVNIKHIEEPNATAAFSYLYGMRRIVRFQCGMYECQYGSFLWGPKGSVDYIGEFGPMDDFGNIVSLSEDALDSLEAILN